VCGQSHAPAASPLRNEPLIPTEKEAGWSPQSVWTFWRRDKFVALPAVEPWIIHPAAE